MQQKCVNQCVLKNQCVSNAKSRIFLFSQHYFGKIEAQN